MTHPDPLSLFTALVAASLPLLHLGTAVTAPPGDPAEHSARTGGLGLLLAAVLAVAWAAAGDVVVSSTAWLGASVLSVRIDGVTVVTTLLVSLLAAIILPFSATYLRGDPRRAAHLSGLHTTLAAVLTLLVADDLVVVWLAWLMTSLSLHRLLLHAPERPGARRAAHEKFVLARVAELSLLAAVVLVARETGSTSITALTDHLVDHTHSPALHTAALLVAVCAVLKTAQLPFHGWLTRVMEAPTPVSALLHAGVINLAGIVLIRLAPLLAPATVAQTLLVAVGTVTAVVGGLVATTRPTVKSALAWSTIAQMGFMIVQCGLGAYDVALLHLLAHSLYKAYAFVTSGSTVERWQVSRLHRSDAPVSVTRWSVATAVAVGGVLTVGSVLGGEADLDPARTVLVALLGLGLAPPLAAATRTTVTTVLPAVLALGTAWFAGHAALALLVPHTSHAAPPWGRAALVLVAFAALFAAQLVLALAPHGRLARALHAPAVAHPLVAWSASRRA